MYCIVCGSDTRVANSRPHKKTPSVWRRRECKSCGLTFTTWESVRDDDYSFMVISEKTKTRFSLPRLMLSIHRALAHCSGHQKDDDAYWLATTVAQHIKTNASNTTTAASIASVTYQTVRNYDAIAGLTYGAAHGLNLREK